MILHLLEPRRKPTDDLEARAAAVLAWLDADLPMLPDDAAAVLRLYDSLTMAGHGETAGRVFETFAVKTDHVFGLAALQTRREAVRRRLAIDAEAGRLAPTFTALAELRDLDRARDRIVGQIMAGGCLGGVA